MQSWSYAAQAHNDTLLSAVPAVLALLFKTISTLIDFRDLGLQLGKGILQQSQLKLIGRALSGPKHKEHVISPCVRLLTELVSFDGGVLARQVFSARSYTFDSKTIARDLSLHQSASEQTTDSTRHQSVRSNTVRYVLANLKFQPTFEKVEILNNSNVFRALFDHVKHDRLDLLHQIFDSVKTHVLADEAIPRSSKRYLFNDHNLSSIAGIYRQPQVVIEGVEREVTPHRAAHEILLHICTSSATAILRPSSGFYPPGVDSLDFDQSDQDALDLGLDSIEWYQKYTSKVPVQNAVLSRFLQTLKPYASTYECDLVTEVFRACPELVADYFFNKSTFAFDPNLTATWIGYTAFLLSVVKLPLPSFLGRADGFDKVPPPISVVMESIIPQPLTQKVLTRCLTQQHDLIVLFATRILTLALQKLQDCLRRFDEAALLCGALWQEGAHRLQDSFVDRCPAFKDLVSAFQKTKEANMLQREALLRLINLYYSTVPTLTVGEKFDVAVPLDDALRNFENDSSETLHVHDEEAGLNQGLRLLQLDHLLQIAHRNTSLRWWHKPESRRYSHFMSLLSIVTTTPGVKVPQAMQTLLESIIDENDILQRSTEISAIRGLVVSLTSDTNWTPSKALFEWLDDVLSRNVRKPIKYLDDLASFIQNHDADNGTDSVLSPLWMTLIEQWPFAMARNASCADIAKWLVRYLEASKIIGEDDRALEKTRSSLIAAAGSNEAIKTALGESHASTMKAQLCLPPEASPLGPKSSKVARSSGVAVSKLQVDHFRPPDEPEHLSQILHEPLQLDILDAASNGAIGSLILCLSSMDVDIRNQALTNLHVLTKRLSSTQAQATFATGKQLYLLLGILTNTASQRIRAAASDAITTDQEQDDRAQPIPYTISIFASMAIPIITTPNHPLYDKINRFLLRGPTWDPARLPTYWIHALLRSPPSDILPASKPAHHTQIPTVTTTEDQSPTTRFTTTLLSPTTLPIRDPFPHSPYHTSITFLLSYIYHFLRTPTDLAILRRRSTFEPLLALVSDPFIPGAIKDLVVAILWRATWIEGGSTTLVTRAGVVAWLGGLVIGKSEGKGEEEERRKRGLMGREALGLLLRRVWESCDRTRVGEWSGGRMGEMVERVLKVASLVGDRKG